MSAAHTPIVSSAHLAAGQAAELSQLEYALINAGNAFERWMVHCMAAAGVPNLSPLDVMVLHHTNHRGREKTLSSICLVLNIEDSHLVNYSLKKLRKLELVDTRRRGKESVYSTSEQGKELCKHYGEVRETCLLDTLTALGGTSMEDISEVARRLRALSGVYDQAARSATSL